MSDGEGTTDRRGLMMGSLGVMAAAALPALPNAALAATLHIEVHKARPPRGSFGIVMPGLKRTAFLVAPDGMSPQAFRDNWIATHARALRGGTARSIVFNVIDKQNSPDPRFDAVIEIVFDSDAAYEKAYLGSRTAFTEEAAGTRPAVVVVTRQIGIRDFDPGLPQPAVKRFGLLRRKPELSEETLAISWRDQHAPLFGANNYLKRYYVNLTDRIYSPDVPWDGYADIWWDDLKNVGLRSDARVPLPESDASEVLYMFMTPTRVA